MRQKFCIAYAACFTSSKLIRSFVCTVQLSVGLNARGVRFAKIGLLNILKECNRGQSYKITLQSFKNEIKATWSYGNGVNFFLNGISIV